MWDALLDLAAGSVCVGCRRPGRALCLACRRALPAVGVPARPTPCPPGLLPVLTTGEYADPLRALVLAHKEHAVHGLAAPLGDLVAAAVTAALRTVHGSRWPYPAPSAVVLVPVPSHPQVVRDRGHDPLLRMTRRAAVALRRDGVRVSVERPLRVVGRPRDQAGLTSSERAANLAGRFTARSGPPPGEVVLVDDVITTGWTMRSAQAALEEAGWVPRAAATVAATRRRAAHPRAPAPRVPGARTSGTRYRDDHLGTSVGSWSPPGSVVASEGAARATRSLRPAGKPMPVAGETVHVSPVLPHPPSAGRGAPDDHGAA